MGGAGTVRLGAGRWGAPRPQSQLSLEGGGRARRDREPSSKRPLIWACKRGPTVRPSLPRKHPWAPGSDGGRREGSGSWAGLASREAQGQLGQGPGSQPAQGESLLADSSSWSPLHVRRWECDRVTLPQQSKHFPFRRHSSHSRARGRFQWWRPVCGWLRCAA